MEAASSIEPPFRTAALQAVSLERVSKWYGAIQVLREVSMKVAPFSISRKARV
ncbi:hypothetical protein [Paraburkholderia sp. UYCP14C]|uniref:hypothetical protein n=1 Tax=Paraburkholderia sp. UYCP14C TaxID=2511130 RepID=UPI001B7D5771|nr:hypothetical protein [Paraburkholderia sp. UYCP14C]